MTEEEIREHVRVALVEALLPRDLSKFNAPPTPGQPGEGLIEAGSSLNHRCVVCDEIATQIGYRLTDEPVAFHQRCHDIWKEEMCTLKREPFGTWGKPAGVVHLGGRRPGWTLRPLIAEQSLDGVHGLG